MASKRRFSFAGWAALPIALMLMSGCKGGKNAIRVVSATYGANCGATPGNVTQELKRRCEGWSACNYTIDVNVLGEPKTGCAKDFEIQWTCGSSPTVRVTKLPAEAGLGSKLRLSCRTGGR